MKSRTADQNAFHSRTSDPFGGGRIPRGSRLPTRSGSRPPESAACSNQYDLSDDELGQISESDRLAVNPPIQVATATWARVGRLDWWVKERLAWRGRVRGADGRQCWIRAVDLRGYFPGVGQDHRQAEAAASCVSRAEGLVLSCVLVHPLAGATGSWCAAQVVRAETVALKGPMLPEVSTARTRK